MKPNVIGGRIGTSSINGQLSGGKLSGSISVPREAATVDYERLVNKPQIENVELIGNKTFEELGLNYLTNIEIEELLHH